MHRSLDQGATLLKCLLPKMHQHRGKGLCAIPLGAAFEQAQILALSEHLSMRMV